MFAGSCRNAKHIQREPHCEDIQVEIRLSSHLYGTLSIVKLGRHHIPPHGVSAVTATLSPTDTRKLPNLGLIR